jgi:hypothetical protein
MIVPSAELRAYQSLLYSACNGDEHRDAAEGSDRDARTEIETDWVRGAGGASRQTARSASRRRAAARSCWPDSLRTSAHSPIASRMLPGRPEARARSTARS